MYFLVSVSFCISDMQISINAVATVSLISGNVMLKAS